MVPQDTQVRRDILTRAAQLANLEIPSELKWAGEIFREADHMSSFEYMTLSYDPGIFTGMDPDKAVQYNAQFQVIAQEALRLAIIEQGEAFVGLILAGVRNNTNYLSETL